MADTELSRMEDRLTQAARAHDTHDNERFDRMFTLIENRFDKVDLILKTLWDERNMRAGAWGMGKMLAGAAGAFIGMLFGALSDYFIFGKRG